MIESGFDLQSWAAQRGWALAGATGPDLPKDRIDYFSQWLKSLKGPQMNYLERRERERADPRNYFPPVQSILCFAWFYFPGWATAWPKISNYAWGPDYHKAMKDRLADTVTALQEELGPFEYKICVDTAPALEKVVASEAGLGWQGKNTLLIHPKFGSQVFLGEIFTSLPLSRFQPSLKVRDHCGTCTRCIDACPTNALSPYELNASKCISYWTLEHRGEFSESTPEWKDWIAGCDICQEVCPWNQKLEPLEGANEPKNVEQLIDQNRLQELTEDRALDYVPVEAWKRNLEHVRKMR